ncbi:protein PAT1 homolog 2 isoform X1 [Pantherophis guttatus]|uniref:Protein PAT1 homolog 2 isoform X1 n=2 Tax=Pantherophis guttatus TaxID=94885 RepID=A0A6P9DAE5_PANGU|nr:protein PAT1 homolog 2 isoform X1 [Pantherophis guttatus]
MAEGGEGAGALDVILEDYFMMEEDTGEEPVMDKATEEDEIDLYINLTFTSAYPEDHRAKALTKESQKVAAVDPEEGEVVDAGGEDETGTSDGEPMVEDGKEDRHLPQESQPRFTYGTMEVEEEDMTDHGEVPTSKNAGELHDLEDPAVVSAVRSQLLLEKEDSAVLESKLANNLSDFSPDYLPHSNCCMWSPTLRRGPSLSMIQALERVSRSRAELDFLTSPLRTSYLDSPDVHCSAFCGRTLNATPQRFMRQQPQMMSPSVRPPYPFTPPRRIRRPFGLSQMSGYASPPPFQPMFSNASSPTWALTHTPETPPFSPLSGSQQKISLPSAMTQLHPLHQRFLTQRQRGEEARSCSCLPPRLPSVDSQGPEVDPFSALMTPIEKDWVIKVQMLQLQSEKPQRDDYYYQEYYRKLEHKQAEKGHLAGSKPEVPKLVTPYIQRVETYESVVRIPGSLGQVAMSTCYSPRRAIDAVHHFSLEQAVGNQRLQVLYQIEKMYLLLLEMEDVQRKLDQAPEEMQPQLREKLLHVVERTYQALRIEEHSGEEEVKEEFLQILLVGKGKRLVARLLPHLSLEQAKMTLVTIVQHLAVLIKKDLLEETLSVLYNPLCDTIGQLTFRELMDVLQELAQLQPDSVKQSLALVFSNKFAISLLYLFLSHGERCLSSDTSPKPDSKDLEKWVDLVLLVARELSQIPKTSMVEPLHLPSNLLFLFCRYVDKDTVNRLDVQMD